MSTTPPDSSPSWSLFRHSGSRLQHFLLFLTVLIASAAAARAELFTVDAAAYTLPNNGAALAGLNGGSGWSGAWTGGWRATPGGLSHGVRNHRGERFSILATTGPIESARDLSTAGRTAWLEGGRFGAPGTILWAGFLLRRDFGPFVPPTQAGLVFYDGAAEVLMAGVPQGEQRFGLSAPGTAAVMGNVASQQSQAALLLVRMTFHPDGTADEAALFVNPPPEEVPATPDAVLSLPSIHFSRLALRNGGGFTEFSMDEVRLASSAAEVAPVAELQVVRSGDTLQFTWPQTTQKLRLLTATELDDPDTCWTEHPALPVPAGLDWTAGAVNEGSRRFYRLFRSGMNAPVLSAPVPPPTVMAFDAGGAVSFQFSDPDCDLTAVEVRLINELGTTTTRLSATQLGPVLREGSLTLPLNGAQMAAGLNQFRLVLIDREGLAGAPFDFSVTLGGPGGSGTAPAVASVIPSAATVERPPFALDRVRVACRVTWSDADSNVERVRVRFSGPGVNIIREYRASVFGVEGASGAFDTALAEFISTNATGNYTITVTLIDAGGNRSTAVNGAIALAASTPEVEPRINSFTPQSGLPGTLVRMTGVALPSDPAQLQLSLGGVRVPVLGTAPLTGVQSEVIVEIPDGAASGPFILRTENRVSQSFSSFTVPAGIVISPAQTDIKAGEEVEFTTRLGSGPAAPVTWSVNGVTGGTFATGLVSAEGRYTAPRSVAQTLTVEVSARYEFGSHPVAASTVTIRPAPAAVASGRIHPAAGGTVLSAATDAMLRVPPAALTQETNIAMRVLTTAELPPPPAGMESAGGVEMTPAGLTFSQPATLQVPLRRVLPQGTAVTLRLTSAQGPPEMIPATLSADGRSASAPVSHFSIGDIIITPPGSFSVGTASQLDSEVPLEEGRNVPVRLTGTGLAPGLQVDVVRPDGSPVFPDEVEATQYLGADTVAGVLLRIGVNPQLSAGNHAPYSIRLRNSLGTATLFPFNVTGLDELNVTAGQTTPLTDISGSHFSRIDIAAGGTVLVPKFSGSLDWTCTGPVTISGTIDATGWDGFDGSGPAGGPAAGTRQTGLAIAGKGGDAGQNGNDGDVSGPERSPVFFVGRGGERGWDGTDVLSLFQSALNDCDDPNSDDCVEFTRDILELSGVAFEDYDFSNRLPTGKGGYGAAGIGGNAARPRHGHIGGGGGGTGLTGPGEGGGGGSGGWGGRGVRIVSGGEIRVFGTVTVRGGQGGRGSSAVTGLTLPADPLFAEMLVSGGGGGGGGGGELIVLSAQSVSTPDPAAPGVERAVNWAARPFFDADGGEGGAGGLYVVDRTASGGLRTVVQRGFPANAPRGRRGPALVCGPFFTKTALNDGVMASAAVSVTEPFPFCLPEEEIEIHGSLPGQVRRMRVFAAGRTEEQRTSSGDLISPGRPLPPYSAHLLLFPGFNTIIARPLDEERGSEAFDHPAWELLHRRILCLSGPDSDGDGLPDTDEARPDITGNPSDPDTDDDGFTDGEEWMAGTSLVDGDSDGDGLGDADERNASPPTDPQRFDTDGDGVSDGLANLLGPAALAANLRDMPVAGEVLAVTKTATAGYMLTMIQPATGKQGALGKGNAGGPFGLTLNSDGDTWFARWTVLTKASPQFRDEPDSPAVAHATVAHVRHSGGSSSGGRASGGTVVLGGGSSGGVTFTSWRVDPLISDEFGNIPQEPAEDLKDGGGNTIGCLTLAGMDETTQIGGLFGVEGSPLTGNTGQLLHIKSLPLPVVVTRIGPPHATPLRGLAFRQSLGVPAELYALRSAGPSDPADVIVRIDPATGVTMSTLPVTDAGGAGLKDFSGLTWRRLSGKFLASRVLSGLPPYRSELFEVDRVTGTATSLMTVPRLITHLGTVQCGRPCYRPPVLVSGAPAALTQPVKMLPLDIDADGLDDVAVMGFTSTGAGRVAVWRNTGSGFAFDSALTMSGSLVSLARDAVVLDANGGGGPDIVVPADSGIRLLANAGTGAVAHFVTDTALTSFTPAAWTMGHLNGDAWPELLTATGGSLTIFNGLPGPTYTFPAGGTAALPAGSVGHFFAKVRICDLNGTGGPPDVLVRTSAGLTAAVNQGGGVFSAVLNPQAADLEDFPFFTGDFEGNGTADILFGFGGLALNTGTGIGSFNATVAFPALGGNPSIAAVGDLSSDGADDVVMFSVAGPPRIHFLLSRGGSFVEARRSPMDLPQAGRAATVGDFDGDGLKDDIVVGTLDGSLIVLTQD